MPKIVFSSCLTVAWNQRFEASDSMRGQCVRASARARAQRHTWWDVGHCDGGCGLESREARKGDEWRVVGWMEVR